MPLYEYVCEECGLAFDMEASLDHYDKPVTCPECDGTAVRVPSTGVKGYVH